jgi:DNA polymerase III alpha subunit
MSARFVSVRNHTWFSLLQGVCSPEALLEAAAQAGHEYLALTDTNNLYAATLFVEAAHRFGLRPLIGARLEHRQDRATVLVADRSGWASLCAVISRIRHEDRVGLPSLLAENQEGLHVLVDRQSMLCAPLTDRFGPSGRLWVEVVRPPAGKASQEEARALVAAGKAVGAPPVGSLSVRFAHAWQYPICRLLHAVSKKGTLDDLPARLPDVDREHYLAPPEEAAERFSDIREAADNTVRLARACSYDVVPRDGCPPPVLLPAGQDANGEVRKIARAAFNESGKHWTNEQAARARLEREVDAFCEMGVAGHALILADIAKQARANGWSVLLWGSAAASLVLHVLDLAPAEPEENGLQFERFLSAGRPRPPDFDLQVGDRSRAPLWNYLLKRYAKGGVARVGSLSHFRTKSAWREACKVHGLAYEQREALIRALERDGRAERLLSPSAKEQDIGGPPDCWTLESDAWPKLVRAARALADRPCAWQHHRSAVLLTDRAIEQVLAVQPGDRCKIAQADRDACAALGLVKIDLLNSRALTLIEEARAILRDLCPALAEQASDMPDGDPKTIRLLQSGDTFGVIHAETPWIRQLLRQAQPKSLREVAQVLALARKGAADFRDAFLRRRRGLERPEYPHPCCQSVLHESHGFCLFDDDALRLIKALTGLPGNDADDLRRRFLSKDGEVVRAAAEKLIAATERNRLPRDAAERALPLLRKTGYSYCKAHALAQATQVWQQSWLKAHAPLAFWAAALRNFSGRKRRGGYAIRVLIEEAKRAGLTILPPNAIYRPYDNWTFEADGKLTAGISCVQGLPENAASRLLEVRNQGGPFRDMQDLLTRTELAPAVCAQFVRAGCFSALKCGIEALLADLGAPPAEEEPGEPFPLEAAVPHCDEESAGRWKSWWAALGWLPGPSIMTLLRPALPTDLDDTRALSANPAERKREVKIAGVVAHYKEATVAEGESDEDEDEEWEQPGPTRWLTLTDEFGWADVTVPSSAAWPEGDSLVLIIEGRVEDRWGAPVVVARRVSRPGPSGELLIAQAAVEEEGKPTLSLVPTDEGPSEQAG